jgi:hypothetical protein
VITTEVAFLSSSATDAASVSRYSPSSSSAALGAAIPNPPAITEINAILPTIDGYVKTYTNVGADFLTFEISILKPAKYLS